MSGPSAGETGAASATGFEASPRERLARFPWHVGLAAGIGAFLAAYAVVLSLFLSGFATATGAFREHLPRTAGYVLYNAHAAAIVGDAPGGVTAVTFDLVASASNPLVYRAIPPAVLLVATGLLTYRYRPRRRDGVLTVALALSLTLGYLLVALLGSYVVTETASTDQGAVVFHPDRVATLLYGLAYPLGVGVVGNLVGQAVLVDGADGETERDSDAVSGDATGRDDA